MNHPSLPALAAHRIRRPSLFRTAAGALTALALATLAGAAPSAAPTTARSGNPSGAQSADAATEPIPAAIRAFLYAGDQPFGSLHPDAPVATEGFGRLAGVWACEGRQRDRQTGAWLDPTQATWAFKYTVGGFGVQDYWHQDVAEARPGRSLGRDQELTQIRVYDPRAEIWHIAFINNTAAPAPGVSVYGTLEARADGDDMIMDFTPRDPDNLRRIVFHDITADTFQWRWEFSTDGGTTWIVGSRITGRRITI